MKREIRGLAAALNDLRAGALDAYREGRENHRAQFYAARKEKDFDYSDALSIGQKQLKRAVGTD